MIDLCHVFMCANCYITMHSKDEINQNITNDYLIVLASLINRKVENVPLHISI